MTGQIAPQPAAGNGRRKRPFSAEKQEKIMTYRLAIDAPIFEQFPEYQALILYAEGVKNFPSTPESIALLRSVEQECRQRLTLETLADHPHIAAWRAAYRRFGANPKKYPCSVESLLRRVLKGQDLPAINGVVALYNMLSLKYMLPVGGEDWSRLTSDLRLTAAQGDEPFLTASDGQEHVAFPDPGEIVWADDAGVTCRRWNWRQGRSHLHAYRTGRPDASQPGP